MKTIQAPRRFLGPIGLAAALLAPGIAAAALLPAIPNFNVGVDLSAQSTPRITGLSGGRFVVAWFEGEPLQFVARVFDQNGSPLTGEFPLTGPADDILDDNGTDLATIPPGNSFAAAWHRSDGLTWRAFNADGTPASPAIAIDDPSGPELAGIAASDTRIAVTTHTWEGFANDPGATSRFHLRLYALDGTPVGAPVVVDEDDSIHESIEVGNQTMTVAMGSDGSAIVVWFRYDLDNGGLPTGLLRRYDSSGVPIGSDQIFAQPPTPGSCYARVAADGAGRVYLSWVGQDQGHLLRFNLDGSSLTDEPDSVVLDVSASGRVVGFRDGLLQRWAVDGSTDGPGVTVSDYAVLPEGPTGAVINSEGSVVLSLARSGGWPDYVAQARVRRFCDTADAACRICPEFDDSIDSDGDLVPDGCDTCSILDPSQIAGSARTSVAYGSNGYLVGKYNQVELSQSFSLPSGVSFAGLPIVTDGMRIRIENTSGAALFDESLPGGAYGGRGTAGWTQKAGRFLYRDSSDSPVNGIRKVTISGRNVDGVDSVKLVLRAKGGRYGLASIMPMKTILILGDAGASISGACSETAYQESDCEFGTDARRCRMR